MASVVSTAMSSPISRPSIAWSPTTTSFTFTISGFITSLRLNASSCRVSAAARLAALPISPTSSARGSPGPRPSARNSAWILMTVIRLLKSWATPPASLPIASILCDCRS